MSSYDDAAEAIMMYVNPWRTEAYNTMGRSDKCERCKADVSFIDGETLLCCVHAKICKACTRDWELDQTVRTLMHAKNIANVRTNAFCQAGKPDEAASAYEQLKVKDDELLAYTMTWLSTPPPKAEEPVEETVEKPGSNGVR